MDARRLRGAYLDFTQRLIADPGEKLFRISFPAVKARYIRMTLTRMDNLYPWTIAELEVYGGCERRIWRAPDGAKCASTRGYPDPGAATPLAAHPTEHILHRGAYGEEEADEIRLAQEGQRTGDPDDVRAHAAERAEEE